MMRSGFWSGLKPRFSSARFGPSYNRCISTKSSSHYFSQEPTHRGSVRLAMDVHASAADGRPAHALPAIAGAPRAFPDQAVRIPDVAFELDRRAGEIASA